MIDKDEKGLSRRDFLKRFGAFCGSAAAMLALDPLSSFAADKQPQQKTTGLTVAPGMTYRVNRHTGDKVSLLGYGMMRLPYKNRRIDQEMVNRQVEYAMKHGVNYYDTSPHYCNGQSEQALAEALKPFPRESYFIATKMSNFGGNELEREGALEMYRNSLKIFNTTYLDYYLLHSVGGGNDSMGTFRSRFIDNGVLDFLVEERKKGHIRNLGFSYHGDVEIFNYLLSKNDTYHWDFVQIQMNYMDWNFAKQLNPRNTNAEYLYNECEKRGIQCVVMEPLLGGRLASLPEAYAKQLEQRRPGKSVASWAFTWVGSQPNVLVALSGMTLMEHVEDNVRTFSPLAPLNSEEAKALNDIAAVVSAYPLIPCTDCKYCMPCPHGVDIPGNFAYYNKSVNGGTLPVDASDPKMEAFRKEYRLAVVDAALATKCTGCRECLPKCPQRIRIPQQMGKLMELLEPSEEI